MVKVREYISLESAGGGKDAVTQGDVLRSDEQVHGKQSR